MLLQIVWIVLVGRGTQRTQEVRASLPRLWALFAKILQGVELLCLDGHRSGPEIMEVGNDGQMENHLFLEEKGHPTGHAIHFQDYFKESRFVRCPCLSLQASLPCSPERRTASKCLAK